MPNQESQRQQHSDLGRNAHGSRAAVLHRRLALRRLGRRSALFVILTAVPVMTLALCATSSWARPAELTRLHSASAAQPIRLPLLQWLQRVARQHVYRKIKSGEFRNHDALEALDALQLWSESLDRWDHSGRQRLDSCSRYLPARYFCAPPKQYYRLRVGYVISRKNSPAVAWNSYRWPKRVVRFLAHGNLYWLNCSTSGDRLPLNQYLGSNRWYRLVGSGHYVNQIHLYTGANDASRWLPQC
jgi:hypothetical protein